MISSNVRKETIKGVMHGYSRETCARQSQIRF